jgi:hypothetical protein
VLLSPQDKSGGRVSEQKESRRLSWSPSLLGCQLFVAGNALVSSVEYKIQAGTFCTDLFC